MNLPMQSMPRWTTFCHYGQMGTRLGGKRGSWERACTKDRQSPGNYSKIVKAQVLFPILKYFEYIILPRKIRYLYELSDQN